ncbi:YwdI family protein [Neobacillus pocheonensis]|uniref:YwdI family protein n=1 Tax=Neobacillus pocheonensis TaxID=363869 RepID=A0ABT0WH93_9BACI|nr:YwdI family protein [Neobacillus pocheonensis]
MNISVQKLLAKIEEELELATNSPKEESLRERVYSIKILCELILDEKGGQLRESVVTQPPVITQQPVVLQPAHQPVVPQQAVYQPAQLDQPKKMDLGEEANGDSLFDF